MKIKLLRYDQGFSAKRETSGFTLIELMIAISIVAIMAVAGLLALQQAQKSGRDARRRQEIQAIATVIEAKKDPSSNTYSTVTAADFPSKGAIPTDNTVQQYSMIVSNYIPDPSGLPADPNNPGWTTANFTGYTTWTGANQNGMSYWKLCAHMETGSKPFCISSSQ